jgi:hypothetical protein
MFHERLVQSAANRIRRQGVWPQAEQIIQDDSREQTWIRPLSSLQVSRRIFTVKMGACFSTVYQHISGMYHPQEAMNLRPAQLNPSSLQFSPPSSIRPHQHTKQPTSKQTTPRTRLGSLSSTPEDSSCLHNSKLLSANRRSQK